MSTDLKSYYALALKFIIAVSILVFIYLFATYLLPYFSPFITAFIIALINEPVVDFLERKAKIPRNIAAFISLLFTICVLGFLLTLGTIKIYNELVKLQENLTFYLNSISDQLIGYVDRVTVYYNNLPIEVTDTINQNIRALLPKLQNLITSLVTYIINAITSIPKVAVFILVTLLSSYFMSSDRRKIRNFFYRQIPDSWSKNISGIKSDTLTAILGYFKAVLILMCITFIEASIGFLIIDVEYALLMALLVAIAEVIPLFGTGVLMVPWILWNVISGNYNMALGLFIIYILGIIIRQVMEPKIVGDQIGLHPLVTLISMYIGLELFGVIGMIIGPVSILILKNLQDSKVLKLWNS